MCALIDSIEIISIPLQHLRIILRGFHQVTSQRRWFYWNHHPL
jgi:predicted amidophosphoribosyltransferase